MPPLRLMFNWKENQEIHVVETLAPFSLGIFKFLGRETHIVPLFVNFKSINGPGARGAYCTPIRNFKSIKVIEKKQGV